jgi:hypothetical protein
MDLKPGTRLRSTISDAELMVVRGGAAAVELSASDEPLLLGRRYVDTEAGVEVLCVKAGSGTVICDGRTMTPKEAKPLPSSD